MIRRQCCYVFGQNTLYLSQGFCVCLVRNDELVKVDEHEILEGVHVAVEAVVEGSEQPLRPAHSHSQVSRLNFWTTLP